MCEKRRKKNTYSDVWWFQSSLIQLICHRFTERLFQYINVYTHTISQSHNLTITCMHSMYAYTRRQLIQSEPICLFVVVEEMWYKNRRVKRKHSGWDDTYKHTHIYKLNWFVYFQWFGRNWHFMSFIFSCVSFRTCQLQSISVNTDNFDCVYNLIVLFILLKSFFLDMNFFLQFEYLIFFAFFRIKMNFQSNFHTFEWTHAINHYTQNIWSNDHCTNVLHTHKNEWVCMRVIIRCIELLFIMYLAQYISWHWSKWTKTWCRTKSFDT